MLEEITKTYTLATKLYELCKRKDSTSAKVVPPGFYMINEQEETLLWMVHLAIFQIMNSLLLMVLRSWHFDVLSC